MNFSILHFPYKPEDFTKTESGALRPLTKKPYRVFPLNLGTNRWHFGRSEGFKVIYDYGLPCTNKIPIVKRFRHNHN